MLGVQAIVGGLAECVIVVGFEQHVPPRLTVSDNIRLNSSPAGVVSVAKERSGPRDREVMKRWFRLRWPVS